MLSILIIQQGVLSVSVFKTLTSLADHLEISTVSTYRSVEYVEDRCRSRQTSQT